VISHRAFVKVGSNRPLRVKSPRETKFQFDGPRVLSRSSANRNLAWISHDQKSASRLGLTKLIPEANGVVAATIAAAAIHPKDRRPGAGARGATVEQPRYPAESSVALRRDRERSASGRPGISIGSGAPHDRAVEKSPAVGLKPQLAAHS
jgi:hypothetical protein